MEPKVRTYLETLVLEGSRAQQTLCSPIAPDRVPRYEALARIGLEALVTIARIEAIERDSSRAHTEILFAFRKVTEGADRGALHAEELDAVRRRLGGVDRG